MRWTRGLLVAALALAAAWAVADRAAAWHAGGHWTIARAAVRSLPAGVPEFFRHGEVVVGHCSIDPDLGRNPLTPQLQDREDPDHYIDMELLQGRDLPPTRSRYIQLCEELKLDPRKVGYLPYSVAEWTQKLAVAFAEYRRFPDHPGVREKCLIYAGHLAHYSADLCQPLHCTVDHDGRARPDGSSPRTGIHARVDGVIERLGLTEQAAAQGLQPQAFPQLLPAVLAEIGRSRALLDQVYALESSFPDRNADPKALAEPGGVAPDVRAFAQERARAAAQFTASLFLTAWELSAKIDFQPWVAQQRHAETQPAR